MRTRQVLFIVWVLFLCTRAVHAQEAQGPTIAAALSLKGAFEEVAQLYQAAYPRERVLFNFGASGVLQRQIEGGAPVDIFASASSREMDELERMKLLAAGSRKVFARNGMVLIAPKGSTLGIKGLADLGMNNVKRIVIGNPATVPAGKYAEEVLRSLALWDLVREKLVFAENVRQIVDYTFRGEVDAGIVFATDAIAAPGVAVVEAAPSQSHSPALYHIAVTNGARNDGAARAFIDILLSPPGQSVLKRRGFLTAP
jgi:molybdate transport system substrate-binding protein